MRKNEYMNGLAEAMMGLSVMNGHMPARAEFEQMLREHRARR